MNIKRYIGFAPAFASLLIGIAGIILLNNKPGLPFNYSDEHDKIVSAENYKGFILRGDTIAKINGADVSKSGRLEFFLDGMSINDEVTLSIQNGNDEKLQKVILTREYNNRHFIFISGIAGLVIWALGLFVFMKNVKDKSADILFLMLITLSAAVMTSPGKNDVNIFTLLTLIKVLHLFCYIGGVALLIHFSIIFPSPLFRRRKVIACIYSSAFIFGLLINAVQLKAVSGKDIYYIDLYHFLWTILLGLLLSGALWALVNFFISFFRIKSGSGRKKVQWALWGMLTGVMPYLLLWAVPNIFDLPVPVNEEYSLAFLVLIPASFAAGVLKYRIFDIEQIFSRSIVYFTLTVFITGLFFLTVYILSLLFSPVLTNALPLYSFVSAIFIALIFNPLRCRIQEFVDKNFYRVKYDFRIALKKFNSDLAACSTVAELGSSLLKEINNIIPNNKSAVYIKSENGKDYSLIAKININAGTNPDFSITVPLTEENGGDAGRIMLGDKLSGITYLDSDFEILNTFAGNFMLVLNRIQLREKIIKADLEKKRLEELNLMKFEFVSGVSHEFKTPLTSIQMFAEIFMSDRDVNKDKRKEYGEIIFGESERLTRMINNILDFSKIERGIKKYYFENLCLNSVIEYILKTMEYQFKKHNVTLVKCITDERIYINADTDSVKEAVLNLLSNAIKYSGDNPCINVNLQRIGAVAELSIRDNGKGIDNNEIEKIFNKFYRVRKDNQEHIGGTGLGLYIVRNIMAAQGGEVKVHSEPGRGSEFTLFFRIFDNLKKNNENNINSRG